MIVSKLTLEVISKFSILISRYLCRFSLEKPKLKERKHYGKLLVH